MTLLRRCLLALFILVAAPVQAAGDSGWFYRGSDIAPDPAWTFGTLPNGLRYAIRRNPMPEGQVSIRLRIAAGSLHERDEERGWAHFIEHMAFRGTKNFADHEARETWQRLGASFGSDTNASTEPTQTVYRLDLPRADQAGIDQSLKIIADMADTALFDPAVVNAERGVVLSELGRRTELSNRWDELTRGLFFSGLTFANRDPIGTEETLKAANPEGLRGYYERWYRPERATLIVVGDADPALVERLIAARFGGWKGTGPAPREPDYGSIAQVPERTGTLVYAGAPHIAQLTWLRPYRAEPNTKAKERTELARALAARIISRRLTAKARTGAAFVSADIASDQATNIADLTQISINPKEGRWKEALAEAYAIVADALRAPPSETEIQREMENLRTAARAGLEAEPTQKSQQLAERLLSAIDEGGVISSAKVRLELLEELAPAMTPAALAAATKEMFSGAGPRMALLSPQPLAGAAEALAAAERIAPAARAADRKVTMADVPALGALGREVSRQRIEDLDATIVRFANGAALVFKQTDFEKGVVNVQLRFGRGISGLPADRKSLAWLAPTVGSMGLGQLDADAIERLLTGRRMSLALTVGEDAWELSGTTNAAELQDQLHLLTAKLAAPRWDEALFARVKASALENYELSFSSASARAGREFGALSHAGDPRWAPFEREDVAKLTLGDVRAAFAPQFQAGPVELIVVGDVGLDAAVAAAARTVGALPARREASPAPASLAVRPPAPKAGPVTFTHQGDPNQAYALVGWSTFGGIERVRERRALSLAANIARVRLLERLRDIEGASYSPSAGATMSEPFPEWGIFYAASELRPERTELFFRLAREIVADLAAKPVAADEFERAQNPVLTGIERRLKTNAYWGGTMEGWSREPELIAQTRSYLADYRALTAEDVRRAVAAYVADAGDWSMLVLPGKRQSAAGGR